MTDEELKNHLIGIDATLSVLTEQVIALRADNTELRISVEVLSQLYLRGLTLAGMDPAAMNTLVQQVRANAFRLIEQQQAAARKSADEAGPPPSSHEQN